ncbi:Golgi reassembly-stacking protein 2-like [Babylonia areolata]|uniref:Golgi reassembly-stacking protein 2-like n=1 Tax=Babylonia areolata TaxID=304850 RepID=UPI003FD23E80
MGSAFSSEVPVGGTEGYHVLKVHDNSPGQAAGLQAYFDFIVAIGTTRLNRNNETLKELLKSHLETPVTMMVYSSKTQSVRDVSIVPSEHWGGQGLLGVSIRFCSFEGANENVWHILEVQPGSPAELAGLKSNTDYVIGAESVLHQSEDLFALIESHEGMDLKLYIYNSERDSCREVTITPNGAWGGEGSLGCNIGYGYLHRIPKCQFPSDSPAESQQTTGVAVAPTQTKVDGFSEVPLTAAPSSVTGGMTHAAQAGAPVAAAPTTSQGTSPPPPPLTSPVPYSGASIPSAAVTLGGTGQPQVPDPSLPNTGSPCDATTPSASACMGAASSVIDNPVPAANVAPAPSSGTTTPPPPTQVVENAAEGGETIAQPVGAPAASS